MLQIPAGSFERRAAVGGFGVGFLSGGAVEMARGFVLGEVVFFMADHGERL